MKKSYKLALIISSILVACTAVGGYVTYKVRLPTVYGEKCTNYQKLGIRFDENNCIKACELKNIDACNFYANMYDHQDIKKYVRINYKYRELLEPADYIYDSLYSESMYPYSESGINSTAILKKEYSQINEECNKGSGEACYYLAWDYYRGLELNYDLKKSLDLYKKACSLNYAKACTALAFIYEHDNDYYEEFKNKKASTEDVISLYKKACTQNDIFSCNYLANHEYTWHHDAWIFGNDRLCTFKNIKACNKLASYFADMPHGIYDLQDLNKARDYAEKACSLGDEISCDDAVNLLIKIQKVEAR